MSTDTMSTYTMIAGRDGREKVVAQGASLTRALVIAIEHGGAGKVAVAYSNFGTYRLFAIGPRAGAESEFECLASVAVPLTAVPGLDAERAWQTFKEVLLRDTAVFFAGRIELENDVRHAGRLN